MINHKVDIKGLAECNVDQRTRTDSLADRFDGWFLPKKIVQTTGKLVLNYPNLFNPAEQQLELHNVKVRGSGGFGSQTVPLPSGILTKI